MPYEKGGRADKDGNRYEYRCVIYQLLRVIDEKVESIVIEAIGEDESGVDIWINEKDGSREAQQCKGRNASKEYWDISSLKSRGIIQKSREQLDRNPKYKFALVSPLSCTMLIDLTKRARTTNIKAKDFLNYQVLGDTSKEFKEFFKDYCKAIELDYTNGTDLLKIVDYLKRTYYNQIPDSRSQKEYLIDKINFLFIGDSNNIYNLLVDYILEEDVWGKEISCVVLVNYLTDKGITLRNLAQDSRIAPRVNELNREFKRNFHAISKVISERKEFDICRNEIKQGNSLVIHGRAGSGKSGCAQAISLYCEENNIPYIAINLDKRIPDGSSEKYGKDLGLPASIVYCLDCVSKNKSGVIILDQLDALRWTQNHSRSALDICDEIINEVNNINKEREHKITIVFVCRTYDLENDDNIQALFRCNEQDKDTKWVKVYVGELDEEYIKKIVGDIYSQLTLKLKDVLRVPSNLYIWEQLDKTQCFNEFSTASDLISAWWKQLCLKCSANNINEVDVKSLKDRIILLLQKNNKLFIKERLLNCTQTSLEYLISSGMLINIDGNISFVHQSIYDYFLVENMLNRYFDDENIEDIIGPKEKQTPAKRYQIQMLLQWIEEYDINKFIDVGEQILNSKNIRFYMKYVFLEVLGQCNKLTDKIKRFLRIYLETQEFKKHILDDVIGGHTLYVEFLIDEGYIDKWFRESQESKIIAINLLSSISQADTTKLVSIIRTFAFSSKEDDMLLMQCFNNYVANDSNEMFKLRIEFYERYPDMINTYINLKELFQNSAERAISIVELMLKHKSNNLEGKVFRYEEEFLDEYTDIIVEKGEIIIDRLLPFVPLSTDYYDSYTSEWGAEYSYKTGIERACMSILKKAITAVIKQNPNIFFTKFHAYFGKGDIYINELILHGLEEMPVEYSDMVIDYLISNLNKNIFDYTSGDEDQLGSTKRIITKHSKYCSESCFRQLESKLYYFQEENAKSIYERRIKWNRNKENGVTVYWAYWGEVQGNLLPLLPDERVSLKTKELICVLNRRFNGCYTLHFNGSTHSGSVCSPISGKTNKLSNKQWIQILTNGKLKHRNSSRWIETKGGFVESSIEEFSSDFNRAVSDDPVRFINLVLKMDTTIPDIYIDALFSGLAFGENKKSVSLHMLESLILKFKCDNYSFRASSICQIIKNLSNEQWSDKVIVLLKNIALNHTNPKEGKVNVTSNDDKEMKSLQLLMDNSINCVRGNAAETIGSLLWDNDKLYLVFKNVVEKLICDVNPAVRMASIYCLCPIYNIDPTWASEKIIKLFREDFRIAGNPASKQLVFLLYRNYKEDIKKTVWSCYCADDDKLMTLGAHFITELYFQYGEFSTEIFNVDSMNDTQTKGIIEMAIIYFQYAKYVKKSKELLRVFFSSKKNLEDPFARIFYDKRIDIKRDYDFLMEMMQSKLNRRIIYAFVHYLEESSESLIDYSDIIIEMSKSILMSNPTKEVSSQYWGIDDELSKLIATLYDETFQLEDESIKNISQKCLDIWDLMFEKRIGSARSLSRQILDQ